MTYVLLYPFNWFIERPYLAIIPSVIFGFCYWRLRAASNAGSRRVVLAAAILWSLYAIFEWRMYLWSHSVSNPNPIRIDLLLLGPLLYLGTIGGLIGSIVGFRRTSSPTIHVNSLDQLENIRKAKES